MKTFTLDRYAKKSALRAADMPEPVVGDDDVLVEVHAAGVNQLDVKIRDGDFKLLLPYRLPQIMGNDVAGVVTRVGAHVRGFTPGDQVYARPDKDRIGTFAEFIAMNQRDVAHKPTTLGMAEAASVPLVALTAWQALVEQAGLRSGQKVFVQAGTGGVGTVAIQLAKHLGASVATTCSPAGFELVKSLGADVVIDYKTQRTSRKSCTTTTSFCTVREAPSWRSRYASSGAAARSSRSPVRPTTCSARRWGPRGTSDCCCAS